MEVYRDPHARHGEAGYGRQSSWNRYGYDLQYDNSIHFRNFHLFRATWQLRKGLPEVHFGNPYAGENIILPNRRWSLRAKESLTHYGTLRDRLRDIDFDRNNRSQWFLRIVDSGMEMQKVPHLTSITGSREGSTSSTISLTSNVMKPNIPMNGRRETLIERVTDQIDTRENTWSRNDQESWRRQLRW